MLNQHLADNQTTTVNMPDDVNSLYFWIDSHIFDNRMYVLACRIVSSSWTLKSTKIYSSGNGTTNFSIGNSGVLSITNNGNGNGMLFRLRLATN